MTDTAIQILRILVVENHPDTLLALSLYLEDLGHKVLPARTVSEANRLLSADHFDLLLCDIGLPDGTGWQIMENCTEKGIRIDAIAMSGFGMNADSEKSLKAGFRHHLLKPFKGEELERLLCSTPVNDSE